MTKQQQTMIMDPDAGGTAFEGDDNSDEIHADYSQTLSVDTNRMVWQKSPAAGVMRKRLEVIGKNNPRLTTIVRFEPGSHFEKHGHPGGEEFLVLSGTFSDASGDYPAGSYVRNPRGWVHAPWTDDGCEIFVKLCQFQVNDTERVVINTNTADWQATGNQYLLQIPLHRKDDETVSLFQLTAGAQEVIFDFPKSAEILLLEGTFKDGTTIYRKRSWLRFPAGSSLALSSERGCRFYCKSG